MTTRRDTVYNGKTRTYATRNAKGEFVERVTHKRSSRQDQLRTTVAEAEARVVRAAMGFVAKHRKRWAKEYMPDDTFMADGGQMAIACDKLTAARKSARASKRKKAPRVVGIGGRKNWQLVRLDESGSTHVKSAKRKAGGK